MSRGIRAGALPPRSASLRPACLFPLGVPVQISAPLSRRLVVAGLAAAVVTGGGAILATAATTPSPSTGTVFYASPSGTGADCTSAQPCSLAGAQAAVRAKVGQMSDDVVVELADGVYRQAKPLTFTALDSGTNGHRVTWRAAASAHPVISGARAVTGWTQADPGKNIWKADVGTGVEARQLYVAGKLATRARTEVKRSDLTFTPTGLNVAGGAASALQNVSDPGRVELESINSWTDRYSPVQSISGNSVTMQQPAWNNNTFGYDTVNNPFRAGPVYFENAYEFLDSAGEWYLNATTRTLYYIPVAGQDLATADVELPVQQSLLHVGGTYDAPAHDLTFSGITFTGTSWLGPSSNQGFADQQTGTYLAGAWPRPEDALNSCKSGCRQFEAARPHWSQMPAAVQVSAARDITFSADTFVNLGQNAMGIGNDANAHATGVGLGASAITVTRSVFADDAAGAIVAGGVQGDAHHPSDPRMVNKDITISENLVHDIGLDYRGITSFLPTYVTNAVISHNEIYNMPYSGLSVGYGWGANDAGGSNEYAQRGLYDAQPKYTTDTTASGNKLVGNYIHDVMQQMNDGGCIYALSANRGAVITGNRCERTHGYFGLYFDEGSRYFTASENVFSDVGLWATANFWGNQTLGDITVTKNWTAGGDASANMGDRNNTVEGNIAVPDKNWPPAAKSVIDAAGIPPATNTPSTDSSPSAPVTSTPAPPPASPAPTGTTTTATAAPVTPPSTTQPPASPTGGPAALPTTPGGGSGTNPSPCKATYRQLAAWQGGFLGSVTVSNSGTTPVKGWTVQLQLASGQSLVNVWNGTRKGTRDTVTVSNAFHNAVITARGTQVFGFVANGDTSTPPVVIGCTA
jgi:hypothetical protein